MTRVDQDSEDSFDFTSLKPTSAPPAETLRAVEKAEAKKAKAKAKAEAKKAKAASKSKSSSKKDSKEKKSKKSKSKQQSASDNEASDNDNDNDNDDDDNAKDGENADTDKSKTKNDDDGEKDVDDDEKSAASGSDDDSDDNSDDESKETKKPKKKKERSPYSVWIGNLRYTTTAADIYSFFSKCGKQSHHHSDDSDVDAGDSKKLNRGLITRLKMPLKGKGEIKGFAYVDFANEQAAKEALALSETKMHGRAVLIKDASNFDKTGRPKREDVDADGNKKKSAEKWISPTLFVGNLSFNTTKLTMRPLFEQFGKIRKIRLMTFEDTGKCKGFAYVDYEEQDSATAALKERKKHFLDGRRLKVEYGSLEATKRGNPEAYGMQRAGKKRPQNEGEEGDNKRARMGPKKLDESNKEVLFKTGTAIEFEGKRTTFAGGDEDDE
ncbi:hypothetical protein GQ42DRAFT_159830 [Ramicandelaber brevisporus]|nr:hypothetical protein GQ42DRAFT_159830 [Ramicandelaber brevisporus]